MFTTFLKGLGGYFDRNWLVSSFFPSLTFWAAGLLVYVWMRGPAAMLKLWLGQKAELQVLATVAALSGVTLFAYLISNAQTSIIRFFEGYWEHIPMAWLRGARRHHYQKKFLFLKASINRLVAEKQKLEPSLRESAAADHQKALDTSRELNADEREWFLFYPFEEDRVMPTRLGNIIRAAELYALGRYGIDAVVVWPRLYPYLPESFLKELVDVKASMTFMLVTSALSFTFALLSCLLLPFLTTNWPLMLACVSGGGLLAWVCYRSSLQSASLYAELIKTAFDLYRWALLKALHIKAPADSEKEIKTWTDVNDLLLRNVPLQDEYDNKENKDKSEAKDDKASAAPLKVVCDLRLAFADEPRSQAADVPAAAVAAPAQPQPTTPVTEDETTPEETKQPTRPRDLFNLVYFGGLGLAFFVAAVVMGCRAPSPINVPVLTRDVPAYHLLTGGDIGQKSVEPDLLNDDYVKEIGKVLDHYTSEPLNKGDHVSASQLREPANVTDFKEAAVVGIPATPAMTLGGVLRAGDVIDIKVFGQAGGGEPNTSAPELRGVTVLDVKSVAKENPAAGDPPVYPYVIVVAVPKTLDVSLLQGGTGATLFISRKP
jgi:hypothetical protein